jgi:hypothetical protein
MPPELLIQFLLAEFPIFNKYVSFSVYKLLLLLILSYIRLAVSRPYRIKVRLYSINPLSPELNPICYLLALLGAYHFLHVSRIRVKSLTLRLLMSYTYRAPILDVSRSHTTTQHSR